MAIPSSFALQIAGALLSAIVLTEPLLAAPAAQGSQYQLVWADEFNGTSLDTSRWSPMIGSGCPNLCGWGNNEEQYYRSENATVSGGTLKITARRQNFGGRQYTSARLRTLNQGDWTYGRFEMRAKLPAGQGLWPAFWLLPTDSVYGVWAASGEMDVMELLGQNTRRVYGTLHYGGTFPDNTSSGGSYTLPSSVPSFSDGFHTFAMEWDETQIRWYVDDLLYSTKNTWWSSGAPFPAPFNERFHLLLNLAVGGNWPGSPNGSTPFPATFEVDYVRVYQEGEPNTCGAVFDDMEHAAPLSNGYFTFDGGGASGAVSANTFDLLPGVGGNASLGASWAPAGGGGGGGFLGGFGRTNLTAPTGATHFDFWIKPDPGRDFLIEVNLQDDDNGDGSIPNSPDGADDEFQRTISVKPSGGDVDSSGGWQFVSIPLSEFTDDDSFHFGGNGVLDLVRPGQGGNGELVNVVMALVNLGPFSASFRTDNWAFTNRTSSISGRLWSDLGSDGIDFGEPGLDGVRLDLFDVALGAVTATVTTAGGGSYAFEALTEGAYEVRVDVSTLAGAGEPTFDPDGTSTPGVLAIELGCGDVRPGQSFGYAPGALDGIGVNFCGPAVNNSLGQPGRMAATGSIAAADNDVRLVASQLPPGSLGYFIVGAAEGFIPNPGGSTGSLCILPPLGRYVPFATAVAFDGTMALQLDLLTVPQPNGVIAIQPGETWRFQLWHRDSLVGSPTSNFTDGLAITFE